MIKRYMFTISGIFSVLIVIIGVTVVVINPELWMIGAGCAVWIFPALTGLRGAIEFEWRQ